MALKNPVVRMTSRLGEMWVTLPCNDGADFYTRRGFHLKLVMERLTDAIAGDGYEAVAREIGMGVLGLIDEAKREEKEFFKSGGVCGSAKSGPKQAPIRTEGVEEFIKKMNEASEEIYKNTKRPYPFCPECEKEVLVVCGACPECGAEVIPATPGVTRGGLLGVDLAAEGEESKTVRMEMNDGKKEGQA